MPPSEPKQKLLFVGIDMAMGGTEQAFLSFVRSLDPERFDITLLLACRRGPLLSKIPSYVRICDMGAWGEWFTLSRENAPRVITRCILRRGPKVAVQLLPFLFSLLTAKNRRETFHRMWLHFMQKMPAFPGHFDTVLSFWGDRTLFYADRKTDAARHVTWLHFDYGATVREEKPYADAFSRCARVVAVSRTGRDDLRRRFPSLSDRIVFIPNHMDAERIRTLSRSGDPLPLPENRAFRLLTVARLSPLKGIDLAMDALSALKRAGVPAVWYFAGEGTPAYKRYLRRHAKKCGCADAVFFLGETENPYSFMKSCDLYVQPSRSEAMSLTVEEAMLLECAVLVTRYPAAEEQTDGGNYAVICDADGESIARAAAELLRSPSRQGELKAHLAERNALLSAQSGAKYSPPAELFFDRNEPL